MSLTLERENNISKLLKIEKILNDAEKETKLEQDELDSLKEELENILSSKLPLLLFQITVKNQNCEEIYYENVYYCADIDKTRFIIVNNKDDLLPNTIDLRANYEYIDVPRVTIWPSKTYDYKDNINMAVTDLKDIIDNLLAYVEINSWEYLGAIIKGNANKKNLI